MQKNKKTLHSLDCATLMLMLSLDLIFLVGRICGGVVVWWQPVSQPKIDASDPFPSVGSYYEYFSKTFNFTLFFINNNNIITYPRTAVVFHLRQTLVYCLNVRFANCCFLC